MMRRGFTLIELLVVISIISLLSSVVLASLNAAREKGRLAAGKQFDANVSHAASDSAVGIWDFNECSGSIANDRSGNGYNGTLVNSPSWSSDTPTGVGCSLSFNGSNQYVSISALGAYGGDFTVTGWVKPTAFNTWSRILDFGNGSSNENIGLAVTNGTTGKPAFFGYKATGSIYQSDSSAALQTGRWAFVVGVLEGTTATVYVDGALVGKATASNTLNTVTRSSNYIARSNWAADGYYNGLLYSVRLYNKSLTASEVRALYASEASRASIARVE